MSELHAITRCSIPKRLHGIDGGYALRPTSTSEVLSIEDCFFKQGEERKIRNAINVVVLPEATKDPAAVEEYATVAEFSLSLLTTSGHPSFAVAALFSNGNCTYARYLTRYQGQTRPPKFSNAMNGNAVTQWLRRCLLANEKLKERLHITADRYIRYARAESIADGLMDLTISLESLLDSRTEISFRFGACLAKVTGENGKRAEEMANLLSELYDVRSRITHGDPAAANALTKITPKLPSIRRIARRVLTSYVLFMSEHSREEWKKHLRTSLFV